MSLRRLVSKWAVLLAPLALTVAGASTAWGQAGPSGVVPAGCATGNCGGSADGATGGCGPACSMAISVGCTKCQKCDCPPKFIHCTPQPPKIKFKCACPKPVCDPCNLDPTGNYGYVPTCWRAWMAPPNYSHCPVPTPTQLAPSGPIEIAPVPTPVTPDNVLPSARLESRLPDPE